MNISTREACESEQLRICRCCLSKECAEMNSLDYNFGGKEAYKDMMETVFNIQLQGTDTQQYICIICVGKVNEGSAFKTMVLQNDEIYLKLLKTLHKDKQKDVTGTDLITEEIKLEETPDFITFDDDSLAADDDDEVLANLKLQKNNEEFNEKKGRKERGLRTVAKTKCRKKKPKDFTDIKDFRTDSKQSEHRGMAPILRENSLKILENSTAAVFQWNKSRYRCFVCKEPFSNMNLLKLHTNENHSIQDIEKKIILQQNRLVKVEISSLNCKICNSEIDSLNKVIEHLKDHNIIVIEHLLVPFRIETKLKCQICLESFTQFRLLNIHINKHYQKHVCYVCGAGFSNLVFLNLHRSRSHRLLNCEKCDMTFMKKNEKKNHDIETHGMVFQRKYRFPCPFCPERFFQENFKVRHLVEKHGLEKPEFTCIVCPKSFITKSLLNNHVKVVHMKEKKQECDVCHNLFYTKSDVARHKITHTGEKNFSCHMCNSPFASKDSLRRHMRRTHAQ